MEKDFDFSILDQKISLKSKLKNLKFFSRASDVIFSWRLMFTVMIGLIIVGVVEIGQFLRYLQIATSDEMPYTLLMKNPTARKMIWERFMLNDGTIGVAMAILGVIVAIRVIIWLVKIWRDNTAELKLLSWARANQLAKTRKPTEPWFDGVIATRGILSDNQITDAAFLSEISAQKIRFSEFAGSDVSSLGKIRSRRRTLTFLQIPLPSLAPHIYLSSRKNFIRPDMRTWQIQKINLEGNFSRKFTLFAPPKHQTDALQIFTPDVMTRLLDFGAKFDFELIGNKMIIFAPLNTLNSAKKIENMFRATHEIFPKIRKQSVVWRDAKTAEFAIDRIGGAMRFKVSAWYKVLASLAAGGLVLTVLFALIVRILNFFNAIEILK